MNPSLRTAPAVLLVLVACATGGSRPDAEPAPSGGTSAPPASVATSSPDPPPCADTTCSPPPPPAAPPKLDVRWLGVQGFLLEVGDEAVLTAPLYTRPSMIQVSTGLPVESDAALVESSLPTSMLSHVHTIIAGHAHYDHLLDVPSVMTRATQSTLYSNTSAQNLMDAFAPDRGAQCTGAGPSQTIARSRVVALDDPAASVVDYTNCPAQRPAGAPLTGAWVRVPGAHVRVYAVCSEHPDQIIEGVHFAPGDVDEAQCTPPSRADAWKEGPTLSFLVDFLDPKTDAPMFRVYYEDAPTNAPIGHIPPAVLADKRVDLALLCVGNYDKVADAPTATIAGLTPRYALGGHWEDFFQPASPDPAGLPFLDVPGWATLAQAAMPVSAEPRALVRNGKAESVRAMLPKPGDSFEIAAP